MSQTNITSSASKTAYICSPLAAATESGIFHNMENAQAWMKDVQSELHCRTIAPHAYLPYMLDDLDPKQRALGLRFGLECLELCDVLIITSDRISHGMAAEIKRAGELNIPILWRRSPSLYYPLTHQPTGEENLDQAGWIR